MIYVGTLQECMKRIEMGLEDLKGDLLEAVLISDFNRPANDLPCDPEQRREHAPTDHASLKDAVAFLLIAADALAGTLDQADVIRLLFNQVQDRPKHCKDGSPVLIGCCTAKRKALSTTCYLDARRFRATILAMSMCVRMHGGELRPAGLKGFAWKVHMA